MTFPAQETGIGVHRFMHSAVVLLVVCAMTLVGTVTLSESILFSAGGPTIRADPIQGLGFDDDNRRRVADAERWMRDDAEASNSRFAVVIGSCTMREAISITAFNTAHQPQWNVMGVCSIGSVIAEIADNSAMVSNSALKPDHVVIGLSPKDMYDEWGFYFYQDSQADSGRHGLRPNATMEDGSLAQQLLAPLKQFVGVVQDRQTRISHVAESVLRDLHLRLQGPNVATRSNLVARMEQQKTELYPIGTNPFREVVHLTRNRFRDSHDDMTDSIDAAAESQILTTSRTELARVSQPLIAVLRHWLQLGTPVTVIFLPEHSRLRVKISDEDCDYCHTFIERETSGLGNLRIVDLRSRLPDHVFGDVHHIGPDGRGMSVPLLSPLIVPIK